MRNSKRPTTIQSMALAGGTSLLAVNVTHPLDLCKTRLQTGNFNLRTLIEQEGIGSLWKGIMSAYLREATYTSIKLGGYGPLKRVFGCDGTNKDLFFSKFMAGSLSGALGTIVGNPFDVLKTKGMTNTQKEIPMSELVKKLYSQQGLMGFYRGFSANIMRASVLNGTKMSCYDQIKGWILTRTNWTRKDLRCQAVSAFGSGFFMSLTTAPFDRIRTTLMNQPLNQKKYTGAVDTFFHIVKTEGVLGFYRGFIPMWGRFAPQATLQLVIYDNMLSLFGFETI